MSIVLQRAFSKGVMMGRPREFDVEKALDAALLVFWQKGYEGASFEDLTQATGVARKGLYAALGNKETLFRSALDRYGSIYVARQRDALKEPTGYLAMRRMLESAVDVFTLDGEARGCLGVNGALACSDEAEPIRQELITRRGLTEAAIRTRLDQAKQDGDLDENADAATIAGYMTTVMQGLAVQAKAGVPKGELHAIIEHVVGALPLSSR
jgi:AcrR family transcriptional regulator